MGCAKKVRRTPSVAVSFGRGIFVKQIQLYRMRLEDRTGAIVPIRVGPILVVVVILSLVGLVELGAS